MMDALGKCFLDKALNALPAGVRECQAELKALLELAAHHADSSQILSAALDVLACVGKTAGVLPPELQRFLDCKPGPEQSRQWLGQNCADALDAVLQFQSTQNSDNPLASTSAASALVEAVLRCVSEKSGGAPALESLANVADCIEQIAAALQAIQQLNPDTTDDDLRQQLEGIAQRISDCSAHLPPEVAAQVNGALVAPIQKLANNRELLRSMTAAVALAAAAKEMFDAASCPTCGHGGGAGGGGAAGGAGGQSGNGGAGGAAGNPDPCKSYPYQKYPPAGYGNNWTTYVVKKCNGSTAGVTNPHGHHIVMKGDRYPENKQAREILCRYGIDPYTDCANRFHRIAVIRRNMHKMF